MYTYEAIITSVYDGDTCTADIDLGFGVWLHKQKLRLYGIDTPEIRTKDLKEKEAGYAARDFLRELILGKKVLVESLGKGKYGRWIVHISEKEGVITYNRMLIMEGHAVEKNY